MPAHPEYGPAEKAFEEGLRRLIGDRPVKIWLTVSRDHRLDTLFSVGVAQGEPIRSIDHSGGFYLLGEHITPDLLEPIHRLLLEYGRQRPGDLHENPGCATNVNYQHAGVHPQTHPHHSLVMHIPFSVHPAR